MLNKEERDNQAEGTTWVMSWRKGYPECGAGVGLGGGEEGRKVRCGQAEHLGKGLGVNLEVEILIMT